MIIKKFQGKTEAEAVESAKKELGRRHCHYECPECEEEGDVQFS